MGAEPLTIEQVALEHFKLLERVESCCEQEGAPCPEVPEAAACSFHRWAQENQEKIGSAPEEIARELMEAHERFHALLKEALRCREAPEEARRAIDEAYALYARMETKAFDFF